MRRFSLIVLVAAILTTAVLGCGSSSNTPPSEAPSATAPAAIVVEREISGTFFGEHMSSPFGLAVGANEAIYCVDRGNDRVIKLRRDFTPLGDVGGTGSAAGLLNRPGFVTVDNELNVWVSDEGNQRIDRYNSDLLFVDAVEFYDNDDPLLFGTPAGVAVNNYGELWTADNQRNRIAVYENSGAFDRFIADFGYRGGQVESPEKIALDRFGRFIVCDAGNRRVKVYDQYGNHVRDIVNGAFRYPISVAPDGYTYWVLDGNAGRLYYCRENGDIIFSAGPSLPGTSRTLREPSDVVLLSDNRLLISDTGNNRLLVCNIITGAE